ncbi:unnamed protein product [Rotaria sordida]|uniref:Uncharacterized protein n=1 Tax=Rotaria sordida TaxID=392033 RepID=A0A813NAG9_9BILA|nr:unnamed protein product [Rotaria sordida]
MATFDRMIIDDRDLANRYFGENNLDDFDNDQYLFSKSSTNNRQPFHLNPLTEQDSLNKTNDNIGLFGRRVYLESPALDNKDEDDLYRYVPSRLSEHPSSIVGTTVPASTGETLIDSLDFELDLFGATNTRHTIPYQTSTQLLQGSKPPALLTQLPNPVIQSPMTNMRRADPRQDPLLGPLLAELDAMSTQQRLPQTQPPSVPLYRRNSMPYEPNMSRLPGLSQTNQASTTTANRTVNDALLEAELYDSLDPRDQQNLSIHQHQPIPFSAPNINSSNQTQPQQQQQQQQKQLPSRSSNMNSTDIFMPSSYGNGPETFLSHFGPDEQLFQQPLFNAIGQNYVQNPRAPPPPQPQQQQQQPYEQRDPTFDNSYARLSPPHRKAHVPSQQLPNTNQYQQQQPPLPSNRQTAYTNNNNNNNDPFSEYQEMYAPSQYQRPPPPPTQKQQYQRPPQQQQQQQNYDEQIPRSTYPSNNQEMFFTDHNDDQLDQLSYRQQQGPSMTNQHNIDQQQEQDSKRQAIWNELQRTNAKVQEKNAKKRESANRREQLLKGTFSSNNLWNGHGGSQQSSAQSKQGVNSPPQRRPPPIPVSKINYIDENIDMIKNKENFYHRYPAKKYENLYSKRKDLAGGGKNEQNQESQNDFDQTTSSTLINNSTEIYSNTQQHSSLPVTINLNPGDKSQTGNLPASVTIPLDSHVSRVGDKISVNIDLRLVDLQNIKQQQNNHPDWSGLDPLDRHIRKLEHSIDQKSKKSLENQKFIECRWINCSCQRRRQQSLPPTNSPTNRSSTLTNPPINQSIGRYGKHTTGIGQAGYSPPSYSSDHYSYSDKGREEDSYLAKMNFTKQGPHFKPYTGRDYEQFKKNNGFGAGSLGFDFDNPNYKEKSDKLMKTKEYAQQVETRNKKKLAEAPRRTLSDTRIPNEASKTQRALEYARVSTRHKPPSGTSTRSTPPDMNGAAPGHRRPTDVPHRQPPTQKQSIKFAQNDDNELVERLAMRHERDKAQVQGILNPSQKRREQFYDDDDRRVTDIERLAQDRTNQRRLSPPKQLPPTGLTTNGNARRPLRFDKPFIPDESTYPPSLQQQQPQYRPVQQQPQQSHAVQQQSQQHQPTHVDELANRHTDEKMLMEAIRQELSERPLRDDEELIVVEQ